MISLALLAKVRYASVMMNKREHSDYRWQRFASWKGWVKNMASGLADENSGLLALKLAGAAVISVFFIDAVVPEIYDRYAAQGVVVSGLAMTAYGIFGARDL